ncbi:MAG: sulfurtransferase [Gammaproteobacteria bacterium]|nr:sulfurtransferase [Gammaproteobacteria bacterium]MBU2677423.1 sulfurtransferase [Gammaproteobacteria bacterium]NNC56271.1 sulfurtransferase [Woeseiaceae bacterium]NNL51155.1 sulfurtransferase [Woeseiaceae bacterium]
MADDSNLVSADELQMHLDDPSYRIVDCRFELADPGAGRRMYLESHIPGAVYADLDEDLASPISPDSGRHPLPDADAFAITLGGLGIGNTTNVIVYDAANGGLAARAWWLLRWLGHRQVQLLDGGFSQWIATGRPVAVGDEIPAVACFIARPRHDCVLTTAELSSNLDAIPQLRLIDARDAARFRGDVEPIDPVAGHIPGSTNLPFPVSLNSDGTWKPKADLEALWGAVLGEDRQATWAVMCGSGVTACHLALSAAEAGYREPRLYVGSWSEWIRDPERPIGLGDGSAGHPAAADLA